MSSEKRRMTWYPLDRLVPPLKQKRVASWLWWKRTSRKKHTQKSFSIIMEKDFWVCFFLDVLFHQSQDATHFCFKGGTSLSKGYHAIRRFSEDIDLILDWRLLGYSRDGPYDKRTFWEKAVILHKEAHRVKGKVPERYARHYYDLYMLSQTPTMDEALADVELLNTVASFNQKFYHSSWAQYDEATLEKITLVPMAET